MIPMPPFFIALSQSNPVLGDLSKNADLIAKAAQLASAKGAKLLLTPELSLTGYPPEGFAPKGCIYSGSRSAISTFDKNLGGIS